MTAAGSLPPLPGLSAGADEPVFREPWEAQAFAMVVSLHRSGLFSWNEWAAELAGQARAAQRTGDSHTADHYYGRWLAALEALVASKGLTSSHELARCQAAWSTAAERTPHGQAIELRRDDRAR